jgi:hypothetical protein
MIPVRMDQFCVYTHSLNGTVFYVGKGRAQRPFEQRYRTAKWQAHVESIGGAYDVTILAWFDSEQGATQAEIEKIKELRPCCNSVHNAPPKPPSAPPRAPKKPPRPNRVLRGGKRGGYRPGAGRPRKSERCACGKYTLRTAKVSRHKCREVAK